MVDGLAERVETEQVRKWIVEWTVQALIGVIFYGVILFASAGRLDWGWGWVFMAVLVGLVTAPPVFLAPTHPGLIAERGKSLLKSGGKPWDQVITRVAGGLMIAQWIVAGLDVRWGWSAALPVGVHLAGLFGTCFGHGLFLWAMASNAFFANVMRIQSERGHSVQSGGPYRWVRHPGYAGTILAQLATPLLLGSLWAFIPGMISVGVFVLRTSLEDRTLQEELAGYRAYAGKTRFKLIPGVW
jgi:protein-S-isoprenylcysteine O-methyltransferase Ste14